MSLDSFLKWLKSTRAFLSRHSFEIGGFIIVAEICALFLLFFLLPIFNLPIFRITNNFSDINIDYSKNEYYTETLEITNDVIFPYIELKIIINPDSIVDLYVFDSIQYAEYQETKNQIPSPINFNNITSEHILFSKYIFINIKEIISPIYIVIEPVSRDVEFSLYYELLIFERIYFIISFIIQISLIIVSALIFFKYWKTNPWNNFSDFINQNAKKKFKDANYADAVETVLKQLNANFKKIYRTKTGVEKDGVDLIHNVLSVSNPIVKIVDLSTENGRNIQEGTRFLLVGYFKSYRNPSTHDVIELEKSVSLNVLYGLNDIILKLETSNVECACGNNVLFFDFLNNEKCVICSKRTSEN